MQVVSWVHDLDHKLTYIPFSVLSILCFARMTGIQALRCPQRSCCLGTQKLQQTRVAATRPRVANRIRTHELRAAITQAAVIEKEEGDREGGTGMHSDLALTVVLHGMHKLALHKCWPALPGFTLFWRSRQHLFSLAMR